MQEKREEPAMAAAQAGPETSHPAHHAVPRQPELVSLPLAAPLTLAGPPRIRTYEELDGGEGRGVFYRPHRYSAQDLAPVAGTVTLAAGQGSRECPVLDVSQSGVGVAWPVELPVAREQRIRIVLRFDAHEAFRGVARVGSVREQGDAKVVGLSFEDFLLDVEELVQLRCVRAWSPGGEVRDVRDAPWHIPGGERFQALVAELRLYLEDAEKRLGALEKELPWHVLHGPANPARTALVGRLRVEFAAEAIRLSEAADAALRQLPDGHANAAAKEWSLRHVHDFLMQAPILHRARHKPFGYPGDYEVMNFIYTRNFEGATLFGRAVGLAFTHTRAAQAVRYRKDLVLRHLKALLQRRAGSRQPVRVLSVAAGPAQELVELLAGMDELPVALDVVLFEQDRHALAHAWRSLKPLAEERFARRVQLTFLHDSIKRLLRDAGIFATFGKFDLVYSCGLFDYLQKRTAIVLGRHLAAAAAPGGQVLLANMVDHPTRWIMEHHLDWPLIYRTREELIEMGERAVPGAQLRILEEESGANPFVELVPG